MGNKKRKECDDIATATLIDDLLQQLDDSKAQVFTIKVPFSHFYYFLYINIVFLFYVTLYLFSVFSI